MVRTVRLNERRVGHFTAKDYLSAICSPQRLLCRGLFAAEQFAAHAFSPRTFHRIGQFAAYFFILRTISPRTIALQDNVTCLTALPLGTFIAVTCLKRAVTSLKLG